MLLGSWPRNATYLLPATVCCLLADGTPLASWARVAAGSGANSGKAHGVSPVYFRPCLDLPSRRRMLSRSPARVHSTNPSLGPSSGHVALAIIVAVPVQTQSYWAVVDYRDYDV